MLFQRRRNKSPWRYVPEFGLLEDLNECKLNLTKPCDWMTLLDAIDNMYHSKTWMEFVFCKCSFLKAATVHWHLKPNLEATWQTNVGSAEYIMSSLHFHQLVIQWSWCCETLDFENLFEEYCRYWWVTGPWYKPTNCRVLVHHWQSTCLNVLSSYRDSTQKNHRA